METKVISVDKGKINKEDAKKAADIIIDGGTCVFPTETVYGLGANAYDVQAIKKIFKAKKRPVDNPLIVHVSNEEMILKLYNYIKKEDERFKKLKEVFWPGPLTIIVPKSDIIPFEATAGLNTMALRFPSNKIAIEIIDLAKVPICAPSANLSGRPSGTKHEDVVEDLYGRVDIIVTDKSSQVGLESTVIDITKKIPVVLRPGYVTLEEIKKVLGEKVEWKKKLNSSDQVPESPGMKYKHYAPKAPMIVYMGNKKNIRKEITKKANESEVNACKIGILSFDSYFKYDKYFHICLTKNNDIIEAASNIYSALREFDRNNVEVILCEGTKEEKIGVAIMNRLEKASGYNIKNV